MAAEIALEASTSFSSSLNAYHVFLSFRGDGIGMNFCDLLHAALEQAGFHTFRSDNGIERGEIVNAEMQKAMQESKLYLVVFSKDYASSVWCLDELVNIMEIRGTYRKIVVPVFYDVDPSDVWEQTGSFAEAFSRHIELFGDRVEKWRKTLRDVAELAGMISQDGYEAKFIQDIVKTVGNKLKNCVLHAPLYLVGIDSRVKDINQWLQGRSNEVGIAIIYGIGGIGKTTIAKIIYNQNLDNFEGSCFLANVRETAEQFDGLVFLQRQLLEKIVNGKMRKIKSKDEGTVEIKDAISCRKILIVFDDVDHFNQMTAILGSWNWLCKGSKVIITTRNENLLKVHEICKKFRVKELDFDESLQLFCWYAFRRPYPFEGYIEHSKNVVDYCCGLPLALQVLGTYLSDKNEDGWKDELLKLRAIPHGKIQKNLKISYDCLQDDHEKSLFLHIACFFVGTDKDYVVKILDGCGFSSIAGIQNLLDRHLISISEDNKLIMNPLVRNMGREIIRQESPEEPGKRSRLWHQEDTFTVLREKNGTEAIRGLVLDQCTNLGDELLTVSDINCTKQHERQDCNYRPTPKQHCHAFSRQPSDIPLTSSFPILNEVDFEMKAFANMNKLKLLQLNGVRLKGSHEDFPKNLVWLCWHGFPLKSIPFNLCLDRLVVLDMQRSRLKHVWNGTRFLEELKILNLSHSHDLVSTPDLSGLPNLEQLTLKACINLVEVHESIGDLEKIILLNLKDCKKLKRLPRKLFMSKSLENLIISGCLKLEGLPEGLKNVEPLRVLHANGIAIKQLNSSTRSCISTLLCSLLHGQNEYSFSLVFLPQSIEHLSLACCNLSDDNILDNRSCLSSLRYLNLGGNSIHCLPENISSLTMLETLLLDHCSKLRSLPELPTSLKELSVENCTSLERVTNLPNLFSSLKLHLAACDHLVEVQGLFKLEPICNLDKDIINNLDFIDKELIGSLKLEMFNEMTMASRVTPLQVLHECGVHSIFLPRSEVPNWCSYKFKGLSLEFDMPLLHSQKIYVLCVCIVYTRISLEISLGSHQYIKISNNKNGKKWTYSPTFHAILEPNKDVLWVSHWDLKNQFEGGDQVKITVAMSSGYQVKECAIHVLHKLEREATLLNHEEIVPMSNPCYQTLTDEDTQVYRVGEAAYYLCNHDYLTHQRISECSEDKLKLYSVLFEQ